MRENSKASYQNAREHFIDCSEEIVKHYIRMRVSISLIVLIAHMYLLSYGLTLHVHYKD